LRDNHDLGVTDALPSVCALLNKAMVHCICTCGTQSWAVASSDVVETATSETETWKFETETETRDLTFL